MKYKILLRNTPVDEYDYELCYDAFNSNFLNSLHMTYWLFIMYSKASLYLISNVKLEYLLREDDFFNRKTLSNINIHKIIFLWIYFLMFINGFNHKFVRL